MMTPLAAPTSFVFDPILPAGGIAVPGLLLAGLTIGMYWRVGGCLGRARNLTLLFFRLAGIALVLALLLQPSREEEIPPVVTDRVTLVAVDDSRSMAQRDTAQG